MSEHENIERKVKNTESSSHDTSVLLGSNPLQKRNGSSSLANIVKSNLRYFSEVCLWY